MNHCETRARCGLKRSSSRSLRALLLLVRLHAASVDDAARLSARLGLWYEAGHDETVLNAHFAFAILVVTHHALVFLRREDFPEVSESEREGVARRSEMVPANRTGS
jgi:hypothetical protein